jgi:RHS repeat-associated protein
MLILPICFSSQINFVRDANGNLISGDGFYRVYNGFNQLWKVYIGNNASGSLITDYLYDPDGNRVALKKIYNLNGSIKEEMYYWSDEFITKVNASGEYNITLVFHEGQLIAKTTNGKKVFFVMDSQGSIVAVTNSTGQIIANMTYDPYGVPTGEDLDDIYYTGQEWQDETLDYDFHARQYKANMAQFEQPDPVIANVYNPQNLNRYAYVLNNPYKYTDPDGREVRLVGRALDMPFPYSIGSHFYLEITPDNPSDFPDDYSSTFTIGAYNVKGQLQVVENGEPSKQNQNIRYNKVIPTPKEMTDTQFIQTIIKTSKNYVNSNNYETYDPLSNKKTGVNSNTAAKSLLVASGVDKNKVKVNTLLSTTPSWAPGINDLSPKMMSGSAYQPVCYTPTTSQSTNTFFNLVKA